MMVKTEERLLESLTSLLLWYKDAGIASLSEDEAVNQIENLNQLRMRQATSLSSGALSSGARSSEELHKIEAPKLKPLPKQPPQEPLLQPKAQAENLKEKSQHNPHLHQLSSQSSQAALAFSKECTSFADIKDKIDAQSLLAVQKTAVHTFIGEGNLEASLMIICGAPSADDDRTGHILSGKAGELLDKMLFSIGLSRADIFVLPAVFWRPPGDRKPTATEVATCLPIVEKVIDCVKPNIIMSLGTLAGQIFSGKNTSLNKIRGQFYAYKNITEVAAAVDVNVRPLHHPRDLMITPILKADAWQDLLAVAKKIREKEGK